MLFVSSRGYLRIEFTIELINGTPDTINNLPYSNSIFLKSVLQWKKKKKNLLSEFSVVQVDSRTYNNIGHTVVRLSLFSFVRIIYSVIEMYFLIRT